MIDYEKILKEMRTARSQLQDLESGEAHVWRSLRPNINDVKQTLAVTAAEVVASFAKADYSMHRQSLIGAFTRYSGIVRELGGFSEESIRTTVMDGYTRIRHAISECEFLEQKETGKDFSVTFLRQNRLEQINYSFDRLMTSDRVVDHSGMGHWEKKDSGIITNIRYLNPNVIRPNFKDAARGLSREIPESYFSSPEEQLHQQEAGCADMPMHMNNEDLIPTTINSEEPTEPDADLRKVVSFDIYRKQLRPN